VNEIMAYSKHVPVLMGLAAVTAVGAALPAYANGVQVQGIDAVLAAETVDVDFNGGLLAQSVDGAEPGVDIQPAAVASDIDFSLETFGAPTEKDEIGAANMLLPEKSAQTVILDHSGLLAFNSAGIDTALASASVETAQQVYDETDLAQVSRGSYGEVAPMYLGVGGNIGIGDRDASGVASFGFSVISKVSLGPRFSIRPAALITNQSTSFTVPLTYNFNTMELANFRFQPYVGAGVDIPTGSNIGLLLNAGADIPISRDFTLNAVSNWRVTSGFGLGITLGVGYNFPFIFE
jgi:opacity protein-like surface antigen